MQYNSHSTNQDCVSEILKICGATTATYPLVDITRRFNAALDRYFSLAFRAAGNWSADDINQSSAPLITKTLTSGTNAYKLGLFTETILQLLRVEVLDSGSKSSVILPEGLSTLESPFQELYNTSTTGVPTNYMMRGDFLYVRPTPNYTLAGALLVYVNRPASYMASTDTTKVPGIPVIHHTYLCRQAALPYLIEKRLLQAQSVNELIMQDEKEIGIYFTTRDRSIKPSLTVRQESNR